MAARILEVADALVTHLNGLSLSLSFTASRAYVPDFDMKNMKVTDDPLVRVTLFDEERTPLNRTARVQMDILLDVGVQRKIPDAANATIDPLMDFMEEIIAGVEGVVLLPGVNPASWNGTVRPEIYNPDLQEENLIFRSLARFTFRTCRS